MKLRKKVIIGSDNPDLISYLRDFIPLLGDFETEQASTPIETLAKVNAFSPLLIIYNFDLSTPEALKTLKEIRLRYADDKFLGLGRSVNDAQIFKEQLITHSIQPPFDFTKVSDFLKEILQSESQNERNAKILVVDDEPLIRDLLMDSFSAIGLEVHTASNGSEAFKTFQKTGCNLVILDLTMPHVGGGELIKHLENSHNPPKPKEILILTAAMGEAVDEIKRLGYPVITKPMDLKSLEKTILQICEKNNLSISKK